MRGIAGGRAAQQQSLRVRGTLLAREAMREPRWPGVAGSAVKSNSYAELARCRGVFLLW